MPDTTLKVGKKSYKLAFDFNAIARVQTELGINLLKDLGEFSPTHLRAELWAFLLPSQPDMTVEQAGELIEPATFSAVRQAIAAVWSLPEENGSD